VQADALGCRSSLGDHAIGAGLPLGGQLVDHAAKHFPPLDRRKYSEVLWQGRWCLLLQS
jgi:hypothetical protein